MTFRLRSTTTMIGLLCVLCSFAMAQESDVEELSLTELDSIELQAEGLDVEALDVEQDMKLLRVRLQDDGILSGRLHVHYATGKSKPATARIALAKDGDLVGTASTDDKGQFEMEGIEPGEYVATAVIKSGATNFQVEVMAFDANAGIEGMNLEGTLTPIPAEDCAGCNQQGFGEVVFEEGIAGGSACGTCGEFVGEGFVDGCGCGEEIIVEPFVDEGYIIEEEYVESYPAAAAGGCGGGFSGGGCCGGGGGGFGGRGRGLGLGLLGIGGLATGITALALSGDGPVSPSRP